MNELQVINLENTDICAWDFEHLRTELQRSLDNYARIIYTDDSIKDARNDRTTLNKVKKIIEDAYLNSTGFDEQKTEKLRRLFLGDNHEIWYMTPEQTSSLLNKSEVESGDADGQDKRVMADEWKAVSERMQLDLETFSKKHGDQSSSLMLNLNAVNMEKHDYTAFLKKFAVMGEAMKINDDEFDYLFYTYGMKLFPEKCMPLIEPLEYKDTKRIREFVIAIDTSISVIAFNCLRKEQSHLSGFTVGG